MKLFNTVSGIALSLCVFAVPSHASVFLAFGTTLTGGNFTIPGAGNSTTLSLGTLSGVIFNRLVVSNDAFAADNGSFTLTGGGAIVANQCTNAGGATLQLSGTTL